MKKGEKKIMKKLNLMSKLIITAISVISICTIFFVLIPILNSYLLQRSIDQIFKKNGIQFNCQSSEKEFQIPGYLEIREDKKGFGISDDEFIRLGTGVVNFGPKIKLIIRDLDGKKLEFKNMEKMLSLDHMNSLKIHYSGKRRDTSNFVKEIIIQKQN